MAFLTGWTRQKAITVPAAYITGSLANFPLSVQFTDDASIGAYALANGYDIRFTLSDGTTVLPCYRRSFSIAGGLATGIYDVLVPSLTSGVPGALICQYGNASAPDVSSSSAVFGSAGAGARFVIPDCSDGIDISGNGHNASVTGVSQASGIVGQCGNFSGTDQYLTIADADDLSFTSGGLTVRAWAKRDNDNRREGIMQKYEGTGFEWIFGFYDNNSLYAWVYGGGYYVGRTAPDVNSGSWHHLAFTCDGTLASSGCKIYVDGVQADNANFESVPFPGMSNTASPVRIGDGRTGLTTGSNKYDGLLDEPALFPGALSPSWISLDYNQVANQTSVVLWGDEVSSSNRRRRLIICGAAA